MPVEFEPEKLRLEAPDTERLAEAYRELGFRSFLAELRRRAPRRPPEKSEPASPQQSKSKTAVPARGPVLGTGDSGRVGGGIAFRCAGLSDDRHRAACLSYGHGREGSARAGRQAGGFVRILLRHGDDRIRRVRRPTRGPVVRRGAVRGVVRPVRSGEPRTGVVDPAPRVRERADRQDRPERQVRSDDAPQRRNRRARYALRYDDRPLSARSRIASRHGSSGAHLSELFARADRGADRQGGAPDHDGPRSGRALRPVRGRGRRRDAAAEAALVAEARGSGSDGALSPHRGTARSACWPTSR